MHGDSPDPGSRARTPAAVVALCGALACLFVAFLALSAEAEIVQEGTLRVTVSGKISPQVLPRRGLAPVAVSVGGQVSTTDASLPPQLKQLKIEINRNGRLDYRGLPICAESQIQPATNPRALAACRPALVGQGSFSAYIVLKGQEPYPTSGHLLVFNGRQHGKQVLLGHIYIAQPFASSFVIAFAIDSHRHGQFATTLTANLAKALGARRYLTGIEMTLQRRYSYRGSRHSYLSSGCPAPRGFPGAVFPLARSSFAFAGGRSLTSVLTGSCKASG